MDVLIIGGGGREHALAWSLARSPRVESLIIAPGNAGTAAYGENVPIAADDLDGLLRLALRRRVDLTVVGPEGPLAAGVADRLTAAGLPVFGPTQAAARLESSKAFAKRFMADHAIPTAASAVFREFGAARDYARGLTGPVVVKAGGLAAGKGVVVCDHADEAEEALRRMMVERVFGAAADEVLIEERLTGPELSLLAFCDGRTVAPMVAARDHKRVFDGDEGPNTGGMGAYAPPPDATDALIDHITRSVLEPVVAGMAAAGTPYIGVLYAGLMLTGGGPKVLEFNCRFGDPETQVILPLLESDLAGILLACVEGRLAAEPVLFRPAACATVVMAAPGYPDAYPAGAPISGLAEAEAAGALVFHAGTQHRDGQVVSAGGRVLAVSATGPDVTAAAARAYEGVGRIRFEGAHYRRDIGRG